MRIDSADHLRHEAAPVGERIGHAASDARSAQLIRQQIEKFVLRDLALAAEIVSLPLGLRMRGRQDRALGHIAGVDDVQQIVAAADDRHPAGVQRLEHTRQRRPIARAVDPARSNNRQVAGVLPAQLLRPHLGPAVVIPHPQILAERLVLRELGLANVRMAVDDDRADVQDAADPTRAAGIEQIGGGVDDLALKDAPRSPVADASGAVIDHVGAGDSAAQNYPARSDRRRPTRRRAVVKKVVSLVGRTRGANTFPAFPQMFGDVTAQ